MIWLLLHFNRAFEIRLINLATLSGALAIEWRHHQRGEFFLNVNEIVLQLINVFLRIRLGDVRRVRLVRGALILFTLGNVREE